MNPLLDQLVVDVDRGAELGHTDQHLLGVHYPFDESAVLPDEWENGNGLGGGMGSGALGNQEWRWSAGLSYVDPIWGPEGEPVFV